MTEGLVQEIIRSKRKTLALQITPEAALVVRAPEKTSYETIERLVRKKLSWIIKNQRIVRENHRLSAKKEFVDGEDFLYLGQTRKLFIAKGSPAPLSFNGNEFCLGDGRLPHAKNHFISWYQAQVRDVISQRVKFYADIAGLKYSQIKISSAKRRWGSCGPKATLNFSWRLMMAPMKVIDYVVIHELFHTEERNHSARFWEKIRAIMPDFQTLRKWLRSYQHLLEL